MRPHIRSSQDSSLIRFILLAACASISAAASLNPHLDAPADRDAFRRWFTFLAESRYYATRPLPEIADCAGLIRWAFRQTLAPHDSAWASTMELPILPALPTAPRNRWGANLFRVSQTESAQFADATTLRLYNAHFISREIAQAKPGDLLFYRQFDRRMPAHVMVYIGASQINPSPRRWIVYHTGAKPGEIRKVSFEDLALHPAPEWRPLAGNTNFLGFWRLNLLRD